MEPRDHVRPWACSGPNQAGVRARPPRCGPSSVPGRGFVCSSRANLPRDEDADSPQYREYCGSRGRSIAMRCSRELPRNSRPGALADGSGLPGPRLPSAPKRRSWWWRMWPILSRLVRGSRGSRRGRASRAAPARRPQAVALEARRLRRVVGQQAHRSDAEIARGSGRRCRSRAGRAGSPSSRLASTVSSPLVLQLVGAQLVEQPDAAPLLAHVERATPRPSSAIMPQRALAAARRSRSAGSRRRRR